MTLPEREVYVQLAEEAAELAQAAAKMARILGRINPAAVTEDQAREAVIEELTDVVICAATLGIEPDEQLAEQKLQRWHDRLRDASQIQS